MSYIPPKQTRYKTAFSPLYNVFVKIVYSHQDDEDQWIYTCSSSYNSDAILDRVLFRECELERLCL